MFQTESSPAVSVQDITQIPSEPLPVHTFTQDPIIEVVVGPQKHSFSVHKSILTKKIPFFTTLLGPNWSHSEKPSVELTENYDVEGFRVVLHWAYTGKIPRSCTVRGTPLPEYSFEAYKVADELMVAKLQNYICDIIVKRLFAAKKHLTWSDLRAVCERNLSHTPIYQLVLRSAVLGFMEERTDESPKPTQYDWVANLDQLIDHPDAMKDVLTAVHSIRNTPWKKLWEMDRSEFHIQEVDTVSQQTGNNVEIA